MRTDPKCHRFQSRTNFPICLDFISEYMYDILKASRALFSAELPTNVIKMLRKIRMRVQYDNEFKFYLNNTLKLNNNRGGH